MEETISQYVRRIMDQKNFGVRDVERNSGKKITASHVSKVLNGSAGNLTADKIVGLALGLEVDPHEVFSIISGYSIKEESTPDLLRFTDTIQRLALNPALLEILQGLLRLTSKDQTRILEIIKFGNERNQKPARKKKKR